MRNFGRSKHPGRHIVDAGRVGCPRTGSDVSVERCLMCPRLTDVARDGEVMQIVCSSGGARDARGDALRWVAPSPPWT